MACIFCEIIAGVQPASIVYQDETCTAFMDIQPINPGHTLVVPNWHASSLADLDLADAGHLFQAVQHIASAIRKSSVRCEGINVFLADGEAAGQEIAHVHLHVIPRFYGDGFGLHFPPSYYTKRPSREELDQVAGAIRSQKTRQT